MTRNGIGKSARSECDQEHRGQLGENVTAIVVGPMPKRFEIRVVVNAAISEPTLPIEKQDPDHARRQVHLAHEEDEEDRRR